MKTKREIKHKDLYLSSCGIFFFSERDLKCRFIFLPCFFCAQKMQVNSGLRVGRIWGEGGKQKDKKNNLTEMRNMYSCTSVLLQYTLIRFLLFHSLSFFQTWHYQKKKKKSFTISAASMLLYMLLSRFEFFWLFFCLLINY